MRLPTAGDLVSCLVYDRPGTHIRRIVTRPLELEQHEEIGPEALCGGRAMVDSLDPVDEADCPRCALALTRVPR